MRIGKKDDPAMTENDRPMSIQRMIRGSTADRVEPGFKQPNCVANKTYRNWQPSLDCRSVKTEPNALQKVRTSWFSPLIALLF
jgi:hypothetical protein